MKQPALTVSMAPHVHSGHSVREMLYHANLALLPVIFAGWFFFGWRALGIILLCGVAAVVAEAVWQLIIRRPVSVGDGSALLTGLLLGLVLSAEAPWWVAILGAVAGIIVGKQLYGGLGQHPFSSVLVGWACVQISYTERMSSFPMPTPQFLLKAGEYLEYPPVEVLKDAMNSVQNLKEVVKEVPVSEGIDFAFQVPWSDLVIGNVPGSIGTVSVLAVLLGGAYLLYRRVISWQVPVCFILSVFVFALICRIVDADAYANPMYHVLSGWVMLGAFFLATEKGTMPVTAPGMILYGIGCGALTMVIRLWGTHVEGVPFAILLMNALTPLLDRVRPRVIGRVKQVA